MANFPFQGMDYSPWSSKNLIDCNWPKKFMQVGIDVTCMYTDFGGRGLFGFGDTATLKNGQISLSGHGLVDATNAFNTLNREVALRNILHLCPSLGRVLINTYRDGAQLYIDGESIASAEGTTQGDPLAMAMYALGVKPLIETMCTVNEARQVWFADDCTTSGSVLQLSHWWEALLTYGPQYGYHPNATKTTLLVKPDYLEEARHLFKDTDINIVTDGACVLGTPIGSTSFVHSWITDKVKSWVDELTTLSEIALSQPQSVFSALTHGVMSHWTYTFRTCPDISLFLSPLESTIRKILLPSLTSQPPPNDDMRSLFCLPCRLGGLGIPNPTESSSVQYLQSVTVTSHLVDLVLDQCDHIPYSVLSTQAETKRSLHNTNRQTQIDHATSIYSHLSPALQRLINIAQEKGSSTWLSVIPLRSHGYHLHKGAFRDALCLRYGWDPPALPSTCVCGSPFTINHALNCHCGGFPSLRHNEIRDITASLMREVCPQVCTEPPLQPLSGEVLEPRSANTEDNARSDVRAEGFWSRSQHAYFDIKVFNPNSSSYRMKKLPSLYRTHELQKRREYGDRITNIEYGSFSPLVFSSSGGMGPTASIVYRRLANLISSKHNNPYSRTILFIRCKLSFALLRSSLRCLRGSRSNSTSTVPSDINIDLALSEGKVSY